MEATDESTPGREFERYIKARWPRSKGGMLALAKAIGTTTQTMSTWFRGINEPSMAYLRALADQLHVTRVELVAILDGASAYGSEPLDTQVRLRSLEDQVVVLRAAVALLAAPTLEADSEPSSQKVRAV